MVPKYEDFVLVVDGSGGSYTVEAEGPGGIRVPPVASPYREREALRAELGEIQAGLAPTRERMQEVGAMLFDALFPRAVFGAFARAPGALPPDTSLRLKLVVRPPELGPLPWELLYDPDQKIFLAARLSYPIVRFVESGTPAASLLARRPLRVLQVQASPEDAVGVDLMASERALREALGAEGEVETVKAVTPAALRDALRQRPGFHVLHYDGHGAFDPARGEGFLFLHDGEGGSYRLGGEMLAGYLDGTPLRLVVLAACEVAADSAQKRFSGVAGQLMRAGNLPAVVAMQFAISDSSATGFTREFYRALADGYPVDAATVEGRKGVLESLGGDAGAFASPDWAAPVLFMRVTDGDVLREEIEEGERVSEERKDKEVDTGGGAYIGGSVTVSGGGDFVGRDQVKTVGLTGPDVAELFKPIYAAIEARPETPAADRADLKADVEEIQAEVAKGDKADESFLARRLRNLKRMAPDILEVVLATLANPAAGLGAVAAKVAKRMRADAEAGSG
jgi:hypothetical protein